MAELKSLFSIIKVLSIIVKSFLPKKDILVETEIIYSADETLSLSCRQISGGPVQKLYFVISIYHPWGGGVLLYKSDVFNNFSQGKNQRKYSREAIDNDSFWYIIKGMANEPSNLPLQIPWIFEFSTKELKRISFQHVKSKQFTIKYLFYHFLMVMKKDQSNN